MTLTEVNKALTDMQAIFAGALVVDSPEFYASLQEACGMAAEAVRKQIPAKATFRSDEYGYDRFCPLCGEYITNMAQYCSWCGQRLDRCAGLL